MKRSIQFKMVFFIIVAMSMADLGIGQDFLTDLDNLSVGDAIVFTEHHWWVTDGPFYYRIIITKKPMLKVFEYKTTEIWKCWFRIKDESGKWKNYHLDMDDKSDKAVYEKIKDDPSLQYLGVNGHKGNDILVKEYALTDSKKDYFYDVFNRIYNNKFRRHLKDWESPLDNHDSRKIYDGIEYKSKYLHFSSPINLNWYKEKNSHQ